jgi:hypothetical protein
VTYNSPRIGGGCEEFYALLRNSDTLETDKITAELLLNQDGELLRVEKETATLHIHEGPTELTIYVPRNERSQEICYNSKLPLRLCEWMMTEPTTQTPETVPSEAVNAVQSVLNVRLFALADVLDEHGINDVDIPDEVAKELVQDTGVARSARSRAPRAANDMLSQPRAPHHQRSSSSSSEDLDPETTVSSIHSQNVSRASRNEEISYITAQSRYAASRPQLRQMDAIAVEGSDYLALLRKVVNAARRATFPSRGVFDMSGVRAALLSRTSEEGTVMETYRLRSTSQLERDKRIGAAGELFVSTLSRSSHNLAY